MVDWVVVPLRQVQLHLHLAVTVVMEGKVSTLVLGGRKGWR